MKNKILLIDPFCKNPKYESPNAKLGYTAAILEKNEIETKILDFIIANIEEIKDIEEYENMKTNFFEQIKKCASNYDYVYMNCEYGLLKTCIEIAEKIKLDTKVIVGGTFVNYLYTAKQLEKEVQDLDCFEYVSIGDPEIDVINIYNGKENFVVKKYGKVKIYNSGMIENLDEIPFPLWSKYDISKYDGKLYLVASKSCSYNKCKFCDERLIWGNRFRFRNYKEIVREIKENIQKYNINNYFFWDASIAAYPYIEEFCKEIIKEKINCQWTALIRADELTDKLAKLMKEAGCYSIEIGIESLNDEILKSMNKGETTETITKAIKILKENKIFVEGSFLIGYYEDTKESILETIKKSKDLDIDFFRWHNLELSAGYLLKNPNTIEEKWSTLDMNYPNQFLHKKIVGHPGGYLDMHIVSKMGDNEPSEYPNIKIGNLTIKEMHELTRKAINETKDIISVEGHNPYI